jgi:integrase
VAAANTFEAVAREFHHTKAEGWSADYAEKWLHRLVKDLFPRLGRLPLVEVTAPILLDALRRVEGRGVGETVHRLLQAAGQVFRYGIQTGRCDRNPAADLRGALKPTVVRHMPAIVEPPKVGELLRAILGYTGQPSTKAALQLSALLFQRPGNIRAMEWSWIDMDATMLTIPAASMKRNKQEKVSGRPHLVPLAPQATEILQGLRPLTGRGRYVFPSLRTSERPMSNGTVNAALRRMGFASDEMVGHGFRALAMTVILENVPGIDKDVIDAQQAHKKAGPLGGAYDRAEYMEQRRKMMRVWADYLDKLRIGADVIPLHRAAG